MTGFRIVSLCFVAAIVFAPLPVHAQGNGNGNSTAARLAALESLVATLQSQVATLQSGLTAEATARVAADTALQNNINAESAARAAADTALHARVAKLEGEIEMADLAGTYRFAGAINDLDGGFPARVELIAFSGTMTLLADGTGSLNLTGSGVGLQQGAPWTEFLLNPDGSEPAIQWTYDNGTLTLVDVGVSFNVGAGGRVLTYAGLSDDNTVDLFVLTRLN